jgi:hypothetical protein
MAFSVVEEREVPDAAAGRVAAHPAAAQIQAQQQQAVKLLMAAVAALGQRFVVALSTLFTLIAVGTVFYSWLVVLPADPTERQIIAVSIYSVFVLAIEWVRRRKGG